MDAASAPDYHRCAMRGLREMRITLMQGRACAHHGSSWRRHIGLRQQSGAYDRRREMRFSGQTSRAAIRLGGQNQGGAGVDGKVEARRDVGGGAVLDDKRGTPQGRAGR